MSSRAFRLGLVLLGVVLAASYWLAGPPSWPAVAVAAVRSGDLEQSFSATGEVRARVYSLGSPASGRVQEAPLQAGATVAKAQVLAAVEDAPAWDRLAEAQAQFWTAQSQLSVANEKWKQNPSSVFKAELEGARKVATIRSQALERSRLALLRSSLRSPAKGVVLQANVSAGDYVSAGQPLFQVMDDSRIWVQAFVAEPDAELVQKGMSVTLKSQGQNEYVGVVSRLGGSLEDPPEMPGTARYLRIEVDFKNADSHPMVGSSVEVSGTRRLAQAVTLLPREALVRGPEGDYCVALQGHRARRLPVKTGAAGNAWVQLLEGPSPGTVVVTEEPGALREGQLLRSRS